MTRIIVSLYGGLGNQLFQYATARAIAAKNNAELILDLAWFTTAKKSSSITARRFALSPFNIPSAQLQEQGDFLHATSSRITRLFKKYLNYKKFKRENINYLKEKSFNFDANIFSLPGSIWLDGYWQSYKYFQDIQALLQREIGTVGQLSNESQKLLFVIATNDAICLHIRRGDYVTNKAAAAVHGLPDMEYYQSGLILAAKGLKNPHCYIFSDDPQWVKENFTASIPITIVDVNGPDDAHQDLWLMAACKRFVIANSSLSWWGAWLSEAADKIVVCPRQWFLAKNLNTRDLIPDDWLKI